MHVSGPASEFSSTKCQESRSFLSIPGDFATSGPFWNCWRKDYVLAHLSPGRLRAQPGATDRTSGRSRGKRRLRQRHGQVGPPGKAEWASLLAAPTTPANCSSEPWLSCLVFYSFNFFAV